MAVQAIVSVVIQKLADSLRIESKDFNRVIVRNLEEIKKALEETQGEGLLIDAEESRETDAGVKKWVDEYLECVYSVEDDMERIVFNNGRQRRKKLGIFIKYGFPFDGFKSYYTLRLKLQKIKSLNSKRPAAVRSRTFVVAVPNESGSTHGDLHRISEEDQANVENHSNEPLRKSRTNVYGHSVRDPLHRDRVPRRCLSESEYSSQAKLMFCHSYDTQHLEIMQFKADVHVLAELMTREDDLVIQFNGKRGSGKTTLALAVYNLRDTRQHFKRRAWASASKEDYTTTEVLASLLKQVEKSSDFRVALCSQHDLETRLADLIEEQRCLVVLDSMDNQETWDGIKNAFRPTRNGSKVLLITSDDFEADHSVLKIHTHPMHQLNDRDSWMLFLKKLGMTGNCQCHSDIERHREKILQICKGIYSHIVLFGGFLSTKEASNKKDEWSPIFSGQNNWDTQEILSLCYNGLPIHSKICLLYLALFRRDFEIPVRRLLRLWLAEGFVQSSNEVDPEDVVENYFNDMVKRGLIQISKLRSDGTPRRCRMLGVLYGYLFPKARDNGLFLLRGISNRPQTAGQFGLRRLVDYGDIESLPMEKTQLKYLRSYFSFALTKKDIPANQVGTFLSNIITSRFNLLRVLDLEGVYKPSLPQNLGNLLQLRYLGLRWTFLEALPSSVGDLPYLETLDLKHTNINSLPKSIWKLKHLRHMHLNEIRLDMSKQSRCTLTNLSTLWGLFVDDRSLVKDGLNRLHKLRELKLSYCLTSSKDLVDWIANLTTLVSLRMRSIDHGGRPLELGWKSLSKLAKLTYLNVMGHIGTLPQISEFPSALVVLTLSVSKLMEDPMPILSQLQRLRVLRLLANSYLEKSMVCRGGFIELRVLKLWMLKNLEEWHVGETAMPGLKGLNIRCCSKLKNIPARLLQSKKFEELILTNMPNEFIDSIRSSNFDSAKLTVNNWHFTPLPWEEDDAS